MFYRTERRLKGFQEKGALYQYSGRVCILVHQHFWSMLAFGRLRNSLEILGQNWKGELRCTPANKAVTYFLQHKYHADQ